MKGIVMENIVVAKRYSIETFRNGVGYEEIGSISTNGIRLLNLSSDYLTIAIEYARLASGSTGHYVSVLDSQSGKRTHTVSPSGEVSIASNATSPDATPGPVRHFSGLASSDSP